MSIRIRPSAFALAAIVAAGPQVSASAEEASRLEDMGKVADALAAYPSWSLRQPPEGPVPFRGVVNLDGAGTGSGQLLYPAPNAVGLVAAIITHSLIIDSAKRSQKDKLQEAADQVVSPYLPILEKFSYRELMLGALEKITIPGAHSLAPATEVPPTEVWVESTPIFAITQDQKAIILNNLVTIHTPGGNYQKSIRAISLPRNEETPGAAWIANDGKVLKEESEQLLAESLDIAMNDAMGFSAASQPPPYKTVRYIEGNEVKIERGQVVNTQCDRLIMRNLRGDLMAVPPHHAGTEPCTPSTRRIGP